MTHRPQLQSIIGQTGRDQRGVALISVLLVFAVVTVLVSSVVVSVHRDIKRTQSLVISSQLLQDALSAEEWGRQLLWQDFSAPDQGLIDTYSDNWHTAALPDALKSKDLEVRFIELNGRFNINSLVDASGLADPRNKLIFDRLLSHLEIDYGIADQLLDWIDTDSIQSAQGFEDMHYLSNETPYTTAGRALAHSSEVLDLEWFQADLATQNNSSMDSDYAVLAGYISVLPVGATLNINTASHAVLKAWNPELDVSQVISARSSQDGFRSIDDFLTDPSTAGVAIDPKQISVFCSYFQMHIRSRLEDSAIYMISTIHRDPENGQIDLISREILPDWTYLLISSERAVSEGDDFS